MIKKNVASQKLAFLMVDATDFATPETGKAITAKYSKDGAALSTCSNSVSEVTSGLYVITLAATETNADVCAYQFLNASCADQWIIVYPETITSIVSNVLSTLDDNVASELTAIKSDVTAVYSALSDAEATIVSDITAIYSALSDFEALHVTDVTAIKSDITQVYSALSDAEATIVSDITQVYSALSDFEAQHATDIVAVKSDITAVYSALSDAEATLETMSSDILEALDSAVAGPIASILQDTGQTLDNKIDSILADTNTISNLGAGDDSHILSTLDQYLPSILTDTQEISNIAGAVDTSGVTSILAHINHGTYGLDALETIVSDILSTIDDNVASELTAIKSDVTAVYSALSDAEATIVSDITAMQTDVTAILADTDILGRQVVLTGTASAGSSTSITLTGGVATAGYYDGATVIITSGTGVGQSRTILSYLANTVATVTRDWAVAPAADSVFIVVGRDYPAILEAGTATAGGAATITLDANAPTTVDIFKNNHIMITAGTGAGQTRLIGAYSAGRVATVLPNWTTNPDNTSVYQVLPAARVDIQGWAGNVVTGDGDWAALVAETGSILADTKEINSQADSILADTKTLSNATYGLDAIETITSDILEAISGSVASQLSSIEADTASILADTKTTLPASISDLLSTIDGAGIKPVTAEPGAGAPSATLPTGEKIDYLYTVFRNKIETTSGTQKVYNDAGAVVLFSCALSDDATTFTKGEQV